MKKLPYPGFTPLPVPGSTPTRKKEGNFFQTGLVQGHCLSMSLSRSLTIRMYTGAYRLQKRIGTTRIKTIPKAKRTNSSPFPPKRHHVESIVRIEIVQLPTRSQGSCAYGRPRSPPLLTSMNLTPSSLFWHSAIIFVPTATLEARARS
ncbi:hypothetical protein CEXT_23921 [Caerostris extrusa]|uniref:Uncharacterized protein n=1 Tax=Caerostris extrusa TaxID=172846 RepID=A0AAV4NVF8_CAEEX|nr:hypothetical protein CEXT_23921 [Caerostris extrusa]